MPLDTMMDDQKSKALAAALSQSIADAAKRLTNKTLA